MMRMAALTFTVTVAILFGSSARAAPEDGDLEPPGDCTKLKLADYTKGQANCSRLMLAKRCPTACR
jgi:hypothetical protein